MTGAFRVGLLAVALTAAATSCSKSSGPVATAGLSVGVVIEIAGTVTATRDGQPRALKAGAEVSGDDVIATAADSTVAIELTHNHARWNLGANKQGRVSESVAWNLPASTGSAATVAHDTSAAGRHAEHSSADTAASATITTKVAEPSVPVTVTTKATVTPDPAKPERKKSDPTRRPPPPKPTAPPGASTIGRSDIPTVNLDEIAKGPAGAGGGGGDDLRRPTDRPAVVDTDEEAKARVVAAAQAVISGDNALRSCLTTAATSELTVYCRTGTCALRAATNVDATERACLDKRFGALKLAVGTRNLIIVSEIVK